MSFHLLFEPSLEPPPASSSSSNSTSAMDQVEAAMPASASARRPQSLGLIALLLHQASTLFLEVFEEHKSTQRKLHMVADLGVEELREVSDNKQRSKD